MGHLGVTGGQVGGRLGGCGCMGAWPGAELCTTSLSGGRSSGRRDTGFRASKLRLNRGIRCLFMSNCPAYWNERSFISK